MEAKPLDKFQRAIFVILALVLIYTLFAPKH